MLPIYQLLTLLYVFSLCSTEAFVDEQFEELVFSPSTNAAEVCEICVEKLEEYDRFCLEAARIQDEIASKYRSTQALMHTQNESFKCSACLEQYNSIDELHSHECFMGEQYEDLQEYADYEEEELVETTENLPSKKSPKKYEPLIYTCNKCNVKFQRKQDYQKHSKLSHVPENTEFFSCSLCKDGDPSVDTLFASEMDYKLHNVLSHPEDPSAPSFNCPICFKIFEKKSVLNRHFGIHSSNSDRPHVCEICGKSYFHFSSFQSHNKIHADIRDFPCKQCSKSFRSQVSLISFLKSFVT